MIGISKARRVATVRPFFRVLPLFAIMRPEICFAEEALRMSEAVKRPPSLLQEGKGIFYSTVFPMTWPEFIK
jgi:hypothetical protein